MPISNDPFRRYLEDFAPSGTTLGPGNPTANRQAINAAAAFSGQHAVTIYLRDGGVYPIDQSCVIPSNAKFVGSGGKLAAQIVLDAIGATITRAYQLAPADGSTTTNPTNVGFQLIGSTTDLNSPIIDVHLEGFKFVSAGSDARLYQAVLARNAVRLTMRDMEFGPFNGVATGIKADTISDYEFGDLHFHDFTSNATVFASAAPGLNLTGIWFDDNRIADTLSRNGKTVSVRVKNITVGSAFAAAYGDQTDGITGGGVASIFSNLHFDNVAEAIDAVSTQDCIFTDFVFRNVRGFVLKLIYGTKNCIFSNGIIVNPSTNGAGYAAVGVSGSGTSGRTDFGDTSGNLLTGILIDGCGEFGIKLEDSRLTNVRDNRFVDITINCTSRTKYAVADTTLKSATGGPNLIENLTVLGDLSNLTSYFQTDNRNTACRLAGAQSATFSRIAKSTAGDANRAINPPTLAPIQAVDITSQTKTLVLDDIDKTYTCQFGGITTITIPSGISVGTFTGYKVMFISTNSSPNSQIVVQPGSGVTLYTGGKPAKTISGTAASIIIEWFLPDRYRIYGDLASI